MRTSGLPLGHVALVALLGCADVTEPPSVASVTVTAPASALASGSIMQLQASVLSDRDKVLAGRTVAWSSSNSVTANVDQNGLVTAGNVLGGAPELVTISAAVDGKVGSTTLSVLPVPVASIAVSAARTALAKSDTTRVSAVVTGAGGQVLSDRSVDWSVEDSSAASVSSTGLVTAKRSSGNIVVRAHAGAVTGTVTIAARCASLAVPYFSDYSGLLDNTDCPSSSAGKFLDIFRFTRTQSGFVRRRVTLPASTSASLALSVVQDTSSSRQFVWDLANGLSGEWLAPVLYGRGTFNFWLRSEAVGVEVPYFLREESLSAVTSGCSAVTVAVGDEVLIDRNLNTCSLSSRYNHYYRSYFYAGQTLTVEAQSTFIDPIVCIAAYESSAWSDCNDDYLGTDARLVFLVATSGYYDFVVSTSFPDNSTGVYRMQIRSSPVLLTEGAQSMLMQPSPEVRARTIPVPPNK